MKKKGFTLVELLAVIVVLGLLLIIAVPQVIRVINNSKDSSFQKDVLTIKNTIELYTNTIDSVNNEYNKISTLCSGNTTDIIGDLAKVSNIDIQCTIPATSSEDYTFSLTGKNNYNDRSAQIVCNENGACNIVE